MDINHQALVEKIQSIAQEAIRRAALDKSFQFHYTNSILDPDLAVREFLNSVAIYRSDLERSESFERRMEILGFLLFEAAVVELLFESGYRLDPKEQIARGWWIREIFQPVDSGGHHIDLDKIPKQCSNCAFKNKEICEIGQDGLDCHHWAPKKPGE